MAGASRATPVSGAPRADPKKFNTTIQVTLGTLSPMLDFDTVGPLSYNSSSGTRSGPEPPGEGRYTLSFIGSGYSLNGRAEQRYADPNARPDHLGENCLYNSKYFAYLGQVLPERVESSYERILTVRETSPPEDTLGALGAMSDLVPDTYNVRMNFTNGSALVFHNATLDIPVSTQA